MDKKATSNSSTAANSSDSYWLACIAHNLQNDLPEKTEILNAATRKPTGTPGIPERSLTKSYPRNPADSFRLKQTGPRHRNPVAGGVAESDLGIPQGDARVGIPAHIVYTAIIDDGKTHHVAWGIRNMSLSGVFLDMDTSHLREGSTVDFLLRCTLEGRALDRRIPAKVVRTQLNGLALQFGYYDTSTCRDLVGMLYSA